MNHLGRQARGWRYVGLTSMCVLASMLAGCKHKWADIEVDMPAHHRAAVLVSGDGPLVIVHNHGPGVIDVTFDQQVGNDETRRNVRHATGRTVSDQTTVRIETTSHEPAAVTVEAEPDSVLELTMEPTPSE